MHLLDSNFATNGAHHTNAIDRSALPPITANGRLPGAGLTSDLAPINDHLDALEAQSIYIFREAFARLKKLALLWSLGKDSNVMIWLARKAFFGRVPFPAMHVDTGKKFPEMYAFRDRYGKEWELDLKVEPCPPIDAVDPTLPPAARSAARKTEGLKLALTKYGFDGLIAGIRRDEEPPAPRSGCFRRAAPKADGTCATSRRNSGTSSTPRRRRARICASIRSCIGPRPTSGPTRSGKTFRSSRSISRKNGKRYRSLGDHDITIPVASTASTIDEILIELDGTKVPERSGRAIDHETEDAFERLRVAGYL